jgi:peptidoglycan/xylan/chitin deacetylase (PgdA/CDA1 family)
MTLRTLAKTGIACAYTWTRPLRRVATPSPFIVGYHRVVADFEHSKTTTIPSMLISTTMLERHIDWLARRFSIMSLDEIGLHLQSGRPFRRPAAAITFDDGYSDVYHHAYPLLHRKGVLSTVFVVTDLMGTGRPQIFDRLYLLLRELNKRGLPPAAALAAALQSTGAEASLLERWTPAPGGAEAATFGLMTLALNAFSNEQIEAALGVLAERVPLPERDLSEAAPMTWDMLQTMHRNGVIIGSHTASHCLLPSETIQTVRAELVRSRQLLESRLGAPVKHFAYPDGRFNHTVVKAVQSAGYDFAYVICQSRDATYPLLTIPRKMFWEASCLNALGRFSSSIMNCHSNWVFDRKSHCDHDHLNDGKQACLNRLIIN